MASSSIGKSNSLLRISMFMDVNTSGDHNGLLISTGILAGAAPWNSRFFEGLYTPDQLLNVNCKQEKGNENPINYHGYADLQNKNNLLGTPDRLSDVNCEQNIIENNPIYYHGCKDFQNESNNDGFGEIETTTIKLNLFNDNNKDAHSKQLTSLKHAANNQEELLTQFVDLSNSTSEPTPLISDSTTTTTTLEVFRPKIGSTNFFQLAKGPLSHEKEPALIVPTKGLEYEKIEKSETRFSGEHHRTVSAPPRSILQKNVQWGDQMIPIQLSSSQSTSRSSPAESPIIQFPFSPPGQSPVHSPASPEIDLPLLPLDHLTIVRRQHEEHCKRTLLSPLGIQQPPRPAKHRENMMPPRPPKPRHLIRKRSQSTGSMDQIVAMGRLPGEKGISGINGLGNGISQVRSASSNSIFKLYQTRDCLGRLLYEW